MFLSKSFSATLLAMTLSIFVKAETHIVSFANNCGSGTPTLRVPGGVVPLGPDGKYAFNGPVIQAVAFLNRPQDSCGVNGENCTAVKTTLMNPTIPGSGSSTEISSESPYAFTVPVSFVYPNGFGCVGLGSVCTSQEICGFPASVDCKADNVNLLITFCPF